METDVHKLYTDLNQLLDDICKFLSGDKVTSFSYEDKKMVETLLNRSKIQLQEISKLQKPAANEEYVDMDGKKDDINANTEKIVVDDGLAYHEDLASHNASRGVKHGEIMMRRKFLIGFEKMKKVYATIHNQRLIIYFGEKDWKHICTFDLKEFEAKKGDNERNTNFELIGTSSRKKVYYFSAYTHDDMLHWVAQINRCHNHFVLEKEIDSLDESDDGELYDSIMSHTTKNQDVNTDDQEEEQVYFEPDPSSQRNNNTIITNIPMKDTRPPLPGRRPMRKNLVPILPPVIKPTNSHSAESIVSYEAPDNWQDRSTKDVSSDKSSSEEDDPTYEKFINVRVKVDALQKNSPEILIENTNPINITQTDTHIDANIEGIGEYLIPSQIEQKSTRQTPLEVRDNSSFDKAIKEAISRIRAKNYSPTNTEVKINTSSLHSGAQKVDPLIPIKPKFINKSTITIKHLGTFRQRNDS